MKLLSIMFLLIICGHNSFGSSMTSMAKSNGQGKVDLEIVYFAEDECIYFKEVRTGVPTSIEPTKRSLPVTVVLARHQKTTCNAKLKIIRQHIALDEKPGINNTEIFYIGEDGKFIRSAKPRIYRGEETEDEI